MIIDGPPVYTLRGREACLYQVYDQIRIGGLVILDDFRSLMRSKLSRTGCPSIPVVYSGDYPRRPPYGRAAQDQICDAMLGGLPDFWMFSLSVNSRPHYTGIIAIDDVYLRALVKATNCETDLIGLFNTLRNIYGVTPEHIQEFAIEILHFSQKC